MNKIVVCQTDDEIRACYPVMQQLRPHIEAAEFVERVHAQQVMGYKLVCIIDNETVVAVAGYRPGLNLAWGKHVYVDDLVTDSAARSNGLGQSLLHWLMDEARRQDCKQLHLDSGVQRLQAHRFYEREGMHFASKHFVIEV